MRRLLPWLATFCVLAAVASAKQFVVFVGDSTTARLPYLAPNSPPWPQRLQSQVAVLSPMSGFAIANLAIGGYRCDQIELDQYQTDIVVTVDGGYIARGFDRLVMKCSINDLMQFRTVDEIYGAPGPMAPPGFPGTSTTPGPLLRLINKTTAAGVRVTILTETPLGGNTWYTTLVQAFHMELNRRIREKVGFDHPEMVTVVDAYKAMCSSGPIGTVLAGPVVDGCTLDPAYGMSDFIHYTAAGDLRMVEAILATPGAL